MQGNLQRVRKQRGWSQQQLAAKLGVSQAYVSLLENGKRRLSARVARKMVSLDQLPVTVLPLAKPPFPPAHSDMNDLTKDLANLGYPGFAHFADRARKKNPAQVLLTALAQEELEARLTEALPWLLLRYWDMDAEWLVENAKLRSLQNRLGFAVSMARQLSERADRDAQRTEALRRLEGRLDESRLVREDTLAEGRLTRFAEEVTRQRRSVEAAHWNLLTLWQAGHIRYVD